MQRGRDRLDEGKGVGLLRMRGEAAREYRTLSLAGEIDIATVPALEGALRAMAAHTTRLVVDLSAVTFIDSAGLRTLLLAYRQADALGCDLAVVGACPHVERMLEIAGVRDTPPFCG
jgi:anti-sigma B factor antagonist